MPSKRTRRARTPVAGFGFGERTAHPAESGAIFGPDHWSGGLENNLEIEDGAVWVLLYSFTHHDPNPIREPLTLELLEAYERVFGTVRDLVVQNYVAGSLTAERILEIWKKEDDAERQDQDD